MMQTNHRHASDTGGSRFTWRARPQRNLRLLTCALFLAAWLPAPASEARTPGDARVLAHWTFDEDDGLLCRDGSGNGGDAVPEGTQRPDLSRVVGVFGNALAMRGRHHLRAPERPRFGELARLSISAWVQPVAFERYNEIFRKEDGDRRVLFSFQEHGTMLSLGLNLGGYVECDAPVDPATLLDGQWHHCVGVYDGSAMRVYLDGKEIGSLQRAGPILADGGAPGCIGSSNGAECFQGAMDDLRILGEALTPEQVTALHSAGRQALAALEEAEPADEPTLDLLPAAHWTFNERGPVPLVRNVAGDARTDAKATGLLPRSRGVHGRAVRLSGAHAIAVEGVIDPAMEGITIAAWVRPTDLGGYREIFRQECPQRVLFSFQDDGRVLALGLNVDGYVECDAVVDPAAVLDGAWHHVAATFDQAAMRVYLDGVEVGALPRPGKASFAREPVAFIGSSRGEAEHFQGAMDDLRLYAAALTASQVAALHQAGTAALERQARAFAADLAAIHVARATFAETVAATREAACRRGPPLEADLADALAARLRSAHPEDCNAFRTWTGVAVIDYIRSPDDTLHRDGIGLLLDLLLEYRPLTAAQLAKQTEAERREWEEALVLQARFDALQAAGEAARFSPGWVELAMAAGPRIRFRPAAREAVAPYVQPATPATVALDAAAAQGVLERDWLFQADGRPTGRRIAAEIQWTRDLVRRLGADASEPPGFAAELAALDRIEEGMADPETSDPERYFRVRSIKRSIMLRNPVVDFDRILLIDQPYPRGSEWRHETRHRLGYMAVPGGRLLILEGLHPGGRPVQLMPREPLHGSFWRPDLSADGRRVLFCFKPHNEKSFHLYEIGVDGSGLRQLTDGPFDDLDPIYLADDAHILFSTTRAHTYVRCMPPTNAFVLARADLDGRNIHIVSANNEPDYLPAMLPDGRVVYTRWEYTDKPLWRAQGLWTINPDGTQQSTLWGNQSVWPDLLKDARPMPGSRRLMFTGSAHHNWFAGSVGIIDPDRGFNFPDGLTKVTADVAWPESGNGPVDPVESPDYHAAGRYTAYFSPFPLGPRDFLVSAERDGKFRLYLMDVDGNRDLLYEGVHNVWHAMPVRTTSRPPTLADRVTWPSREQRHRPEPGVLYSANVHQGTPESLRGRARFLRVWSIDAKTYTYWHKRPWLSTGPVVSGVQSEGVKRLLGTVPLEADGSVSFTAPAGKALHFQVLDDHGRALQTMRSFVGVLPGERRGCLGCHEAHSRAPLNPPSPPQALRQPPRPIDPPPWEDVTVSYPRYVQPVLDQYCGRCHQGEGKARAVLDLTLRPGAPIFPEPYHTLIGRPTWGKPYERPEKPPPGWGIADTLLVEAYDQRDPEAYVTPPPLTALSYRSRLIELAGSGKHHGVRVDAISLARLMAWVDAMCPYAGDEEVRREEDPDFPGVDWLAVRPRVRTAPVVVRPGPVDGEGAP